MKLLLDTNIVSYWMRGASKSNSKKATMHYASIRTALKKKGHLISEQDLQIAAIALSNELRVVTHNTKEFTRIPNLEVIDWK